MFFDRRLDSPPKVLTGMQANITEGSSLSEAMKKHPDVFPSQFPSLVAKKKKKKKKKKIEPTF
ncbi:hypothetical protein [Leptospira borgpetersenii]|uniref:hypothetical protein n=1 Tax=Leptospira borgpetersenii TaxID=174 RepID=UPI0007A75302|nr:hypothetical protein [Leptospira borgpetersenii]